jgi:hypothetical protein
LLQKPETVTISFTPGFSPVSKNDKKRETALAVSSSVHNTEAVDYLGVRSAATRETVETVSSCVAKLTPG